MKRSHSEKYAGWALECEEFLLVQWDFSLVSGTFLSLDKSPLQSKRVCGFSDSKHKWRFIPFFHLSVGGWGRV